MQSILKRLLKLCFRADISIKIVFFSVLVLNVPSVHFLSFKYYMRHLEKSISNVSQQEEQHQQHQQQLLNS